MMARTPSQKFRVDDAEWQLRLRLAAAYRAVDYFGWSDLTANHISLRANAARPDAHCVLHVHTMAGMTIACLRDGLLPLTLEGTDFHNRIGYHDFEGPVLDADERPRLVASLGDNVALILRNHGLITIGETVDSAFLRMYRLVLACEVQMRVMMTGQPFTRISDDTLEKSAQRHDGFFRIGPGGRTIGHGELDFSAVMRLMAKIDPGYQE